MKKYVVILFTVLGLLGAYSLTDDCNSTDAEAIAEMSVVIKEPGAEEIAKTTQSIIMELGRDYPAGTTTFYKDGIQHSIMALAFVYQQMLMHTGQFKCIDRNTESWMYESNLMKVDYTEDKELLSGSVAKVTVKFRNTGETYIIIFRK